LRGPHLKPEQALYELSPPKLAPENQNQRLPTLKSKYQKRENKKSIIHSPSITQWQNNYEISNPVL